MNPGRALQALLQTDPRDPGCADTFEQLHLYAEILARGDDPEVLMPGITAHLRACHPCGEDLIGLLAALENEPTGESRGG